MAFRLSSHHIEGESHHGHHEDREEDPCSSSGEEEEDQDEDLTWEDWVSDPESKRPCKSLFDEKELPSATAAVEHDKATHGFDLERICTSLGLDVHQRIRLINWIRKEKPTPSTVAALTGHEEYLKLDEYLKPSIEDDPLLQLQPDDWSDDEDIEKPYEAPKDLQQATRQIHRLEEKLKRAQQDLADYRSLVSKRLNIVGLAEALKEPVASSSTHIAAPLRDDDSHYFQSYGENDIHAIMIQDKVRTASYASFISKNPTLFRDAIVLDVGCGTGILSLFAARAGAKRVIAVDASDIAEKAEEIVKANGLGNVIKVVRGKIEDINLPDDITHVDIIISEWMGYALLYESMLDSVLHARDRFLRPGSGVIAPSQAKMMFALCDAKDIYKERIEFWSDVYGFDLSAMAARVYEDAVVDVVGPDSLASAPCIVKDLYLGDVAARQLDFSAPFSLVSTAERRTKIHSFVLYFDTFFNPTGLPVPDDSEVRVIREGDPVLAEIWPVGGKPHPTRRMSSGDPLKSPKPKITSFSTGPTSMPTHWKQTLFLLREPIMVDEGTVVQGVLKCRKSEDNSRELDVEIHYAVREADATELGDAVIQTFKVR